MIDEARPRLRCAKCHARQLVVGPDGFSDCQSCGATTRPRAIVRIGGRCVVIDLAGATAEQIAGQLVLL